MDAPDFDELEWMAQQVPPPFDYDDEMEAMTYAEEERFPAPKTDHHNEPAADVSRKRSWSSEVAANEEHRATNQALHKRGKGHEENAMGIDNELFDNDWAAPPPHNVAPPSSSNVTSCQPSSSEFSSAGVKLPKRRLADIRGDFIPITNTLGERVYANIQKDEKQTSIRQDIRSTYRRSNHGLLSEPFELLLQRVEQEAIQKACRVTEQDLNEEDPVNMTTHEQLWVEKYAPKSFTELLSDEQTNREVLRWLKEWDTCVFGGKKTSTSVDVFSALKHHVSAHHNRQSLHSIHSSSKASSVPKVEEDMSKRKIDQVMDRPEEKILLLCGPPGLGKTTLAHVAAKHCGYRVVEINASDDRVATTLQAKILDAVQMKSVMGDMRPNCVVIDEIDGALNGADGKGAIDALLKIAFSEKKGILDKENHTDAIQEEKHSKKKGSKTGRLLRPVICICNDPYAPALRQLRQMARVHVFVQPNANRVVTRLKYICNLEGYIVSARALTALAEHTECDIRSCLNTLQFLKRKKENLNMLDMSTQVVGRKDMTSNAFDIWGEIFQKRKPKHKSIRVSTESCGQEHREFLRIHELIANHGDYQLLSEGMHDNLQHLRYHDSSLQKMVECLELLGNSEITSHHALRNQFFALNAYLPAYAIGIRHLIAQPEKPQLEWPKTFQRYHVEHSAKLELLKSWMRSMQPMTYQSITAGCLTDDLISPLLYILSPQTLRPVAPQLLSQSEKEEIAQLVDTMIGYGVNYRPSKASYMSGDRFDNHMEFQGLVLEPPIHKLVNFKDFKSGHRLLSLTLRQVLSHEVELETIRRETVARAARAVALTSELQGLSISKEAVGEGNKGSSGRRLDAETCAVACTSNAQPVENIKAKENVSIAVPRKPAVNFFSWFKGQSESSCKAEKDSNSKDVLAHRDSRPLLFKFNEGFTNAIRRPMLVRDFL